MRGQRLQFSLSVMFAVVTTICVWLAVVSMKAHRQAAAVAKIRALAGLAEYDYQVDEAGNFNPLAPCPGPRWLQSAFGVDYFGTVVSIEFTGEQQLSGADLVVLEELPHLRTLIISGTSVGDDALCHVARCSRLNTLIANSTEITAKGLSQLRSLRELHALSLLAVPIGIDEIREFERMPALESLNLTNTGLTDTTMMLLRNVANLRELEMGWNNVTDKSLIAIGEMVNLKYVGVVGTRITANARRSEKFAHITWNPY